MISPLNVQPLQEWPVGERVMSAYEQTRVVGVSMNASSSFIIVNQAYLSALTILFPSSSFMKFFHNSIYVLTDFRRESLLTCPRILGEGTSSVDRKPSRNPLVWHLGTLSVAAYILVRGFLIYALQEGSETLIPNATCSFFPNPQRIFKQSRSRKRERPPGDRKYDSENWNKMNFRFLMRATRMQTFGGFPQHGIQTVHVPQHRWGLSAVNRSCSDNTSGAVVLIERMDSELCQGGVGIIIPDRGPILESFMVG
ncbi:uncharacterized protein LACBIDRAFT_333012 [Laccaria bicolor S238N-H82]|uniref:Predicted protein n=1 Tax=Laccaria bicolor (strain S238N-H82 / ATCC MYA-4686) TaxID=486041 RepID=B0DUJ6_LACBS|nr:uncharacterized protein LACBIDRAFT_333012 [Laccaria bicolor S238N-H82]EDR01753.1 predicted protein [Laccaria bicolor S238N-H82]|eukprot:XP_001887566.1 predicted protein [Laccaria bicolor S238N-H82]